MRLRVPLKIVREAIKQYFKKGVLIVSSRDYKREVEDDSTRIVEVVKTRHMSLTSILLLVVVLLIIICIIKDPKFAADILKIAFNAIF